MNKTVQARKDRYFLNIVKMPCLRVGYLKGLQVNGPYLKAKNCPNPSLSKSTVRPKKDITNHITLPVKAARPISIRLQPRAANVPGSQKPDLKPPKLLGKRPALGYVSYNANCRPPSRSKQKHKTGPPTRQRSRETVQLLDTQGLEAASQQVTGPGTAACADSVDSTCGGGRYLQSCLEDANKENLPHDLLGSKGKPQLPLWARSKPDASSHSKTKSSGALPASGRRLPTHAALEDGAKVQYVGATLTSTLAGKLQQLPIGTAGSAPETVPSHFVQTLGTQASKEPGAKDRKVNEGKHEGPGRAKPQSRAVTKQKAEQTRPRACPTLLQRRPDSRHLKSKQDRKPIQPCPGHQASCMQQRPKAISQRPQLALGSVTTHTPNTRANGPNGHKHSSCQQKARTLDSKLKGALPQNHFLNKTAPQTQAGSTAINRRGAPDGGQTNAGVKKATAGDRRKQLEEWQKSKGKVYKRPPMELRTKRRVVEQMNMSFWKSMETEREAQYELSSRISSTLAECLRLIEQGVLPDEVFTILSSIPEAEKFAKFWICKAKFLASKGTFDVVGLYEEAVRHGAAPIQELREAVLHILQDPSRTADGITSNSSVAETNRSSVEDSAQEVECGKSCLSPKEMGQVPATPHMTKVGQDSLPGIKLQVAPLPRTSGRPEGQGLKLITPVRRSARIERAVSRYPEMLQDHDLVVASLNELLEVEETEYFVFRRNEALPVTLGFQVLES
ncbi:cytoskeleton-associated protein 2-like isoform X1 [Pteropus medius]|uniref:cytoskeleton-associated protein 2-like isoform X1 n=1 Tax=Pteropus vampyrus TaxID=132908 RepID=UPI00196A5B76|nr:cytoskeleton-associated protein 2-like isoform X1 [Pteropus giganteus]XP_039728555.1 cytoskeleton-associated protein 2-like isoform X1 [Pteropus giganteus]